MLSMDTLIFVIAAFIGALIAGVAGFAFGLIASAVWLHVITPAQSAVLIAGFAIVIQGLTLWRLRHALEFRRILPFVVGGAAGIPLGAALLRWISAAQMRTVIGIGLVLFSIYSLAQPRLHRTRGSAMGDGIVGVASGFLGGSTGLAGIPVIVWSTVRGWSKDEQRAVFQPVAMAIFFMAMAWFGGAGLVTPEALRLFLLGLPAVLLGTWLGFKLYGRVDETAFRKIVLVLLLLSGVTLVPGGILVGK
jgi:uncharacterized membrane protein YfcA